MHATEPFHSPYRHNSPEIPCSSSDCTLLRRGTHECNNYPDIRWRHLVATWLVPRAPDQAVWVRVLHDWDHLAVFLGHNGITNSEVIKTFLLLCSSGYFVSNVASLFVGQRQKLSNEALPNSIRSLPITRWVSIRRKDKPIGPTIVKRAKWVHTDVLFSLLQRSRAINRASGCTSEFTHGGLWHGWGTLTQTSLGFLRFFCFLPKLTPLLYKRKLCVFSYYV